MGVGANNNNDKSQTKHNHKYLKVPTQSPLPNNKKTDDPLPSTKTNIRSYNHTNHNIHNHTKRSSSYLKSQNAKINNRNINTALREIQIDDQDSDSELDDDDFPEATHSQEQKSLMDQSKSNRGQRGHHHHNHHHNHNQLCANSQLSLRHPWANKELSWWNHFCIGAYWFGWAFLWMPLLVIVIPHQVEYIVDGNNSGKSMGSVFLIGSIGSLICSPVFGHLSDNSQNAMGRRRPFLMVGICITTIGLLLMSISPPYTIYCIGFFICSCGNFITLAPYSALVPDVVPFDQRGICSGWLGACSMFGYLLGGAMSYHLEKLGFFLTFVFLTMTHAFFGWITLRFVPEIHIKQGYQTVDITHNETDDDDGEYDQDIEIEDNQLEISHGITRHSMDVDDRDPQFKNRMNGQNRYNLGFFESSPFWNMDFVWLFISRFFIQMGAIIVQENLQFYLRDTKGGDFTVFGILLAKDEVQAVAVLFAPLLFGALISSIVSGIISDIYGQQRKFLVYFSGICMSLCCILFGINRWFMFDIIISLFFGFGFGVFSAIDWAMATDVLPNPNCYGRDMGYWNLSMTLPQIIGSPIVGYLLDVFRQINYIHLGWLAIFVFSATNFIIGTFLVKKIAHVK